MLRDRQFFNDVYVKSSSGYSLVHILSTSSSKSTPRLSVFLRFLREIELSLQSCAHFVDHCPGSRRAPAETETRQRQPRTATLPEKTQGFAPESVFSREFMRSRALTLPNYLYLLMMWLTWWCGWWRLRWWCGCHDGETASHGQSSVTWKFPN